MLHSAHCIGLYLPFHSYPSRSTLAATVRGWTTRERSSSAPPILSSDAAGRPVDALGKLHRAHSLGSGRCTTTGERPTIRRVGLLEHRLDLLVRPSDKRRR